MSCFEKVFGKEKFLTIINNFLAPLKSPGEQKVSDETEADTAKVARVGLPECVCVCVYVRVCL